MRPLLALVVVAAILGGLQLYMTFRPQAGREAFRAEMAATGRYDVEVTLTFAAGPDEFALDVSDAPSLLILLRGQELLRRTDSIAAGSQVVARGVEGVVVGGNEFFVQASAQDTAANIARALRVRILRDDHPLADETLWAEPGDVVQGAVVVQVPAWAGGAESRGVAETNVESE